MFYNQFKYKMRKKLEEIDFPKNVNNIPEIIHKCNIIIEIVNRYTNILSSKKCNDEECNNDNFINGYCGDHYKSSYNDINKLFSSIKENIDTMCDNEILYLGVYTISTISDLDNNMKNHKNKFFTFHKKIKRPTCQYESNTSSANNIINISDTIRTYMKDDIKMHCDKMICIKHIDKNLQNLNDKIEKQYERILLSKYSEYDSIDLEAYFSQLSEHADNCTFPVKEYKCWRYIAKYLEFKIFNVASSYKKFNAYRIKSIYEYYAYNSLIKISEKNIMWFKREVTFFDLKYKSLLFYDFHGYINIDKNITVEFAIEIDGPFHSEDIQIKRDHLKNKYSISNCIHLLRVDIHSTKKGTNEINNIINNFIQDIKNTKRIIFKQV